MRQIRLAWMTKRYCEYHLSLCITVHHGLLKQEHESLNVLLGGFYAHVNTI